MWYRNYKQGQGTYTYKNGDVYSGNWVNDKKEGKGTLYNPNSSYQLVGIWENNQLKRGKWIMEDGTIYSGLYENVTKIKNSRINQVVQVYSHSQMVSK